MTGEIVESKHYVRVCLSVCWFNVVIGGGAIEIRKDHSPLSRILPTEIEVFDDSVPTENSNLFPDEYNLTNKMCEKRRREFITGRTGARTIIERMGLEPVPILMDNRGAPQWPPNVVGSISHTSTRCIAACGYEKDFASIGVDIEDNLPITEGTLRLVASDIEIEMLDGIVSDIALGTLLFSIKESVYKAQYGLTKTWLDFPDVSIHLEPDMGIFHAQIKKDVSFSPAAYDALKGYFCLEKSFIFTAIALRHTDICFD